MLENLVGVTADKNWLPHHTEGGFLSEGDEHPDPGILHKTERAVLPVMRRLSTSVPHIGPWIHRRMRKVGEQLLGGSEEVIRSGNWWGNDTAWRMCLDLNKIIAFGNLDGTFRHEFPENRKPHYSLVDGIISGQGRGPMNPDPTFTGIVVFGTNPPSVDAVCAQLMGFDLNHIPIVCQAFQCKRFPITEWDWHDIQVVSNNSRWNGFIHDLEDEFTFHFEPHFGWKGKIERNVN